LVKIQVTIVDDSQREKCNSHCGVDWSSAEVIALASNQIKERFGNITKLNYLDLSKPMTNHHAVELKQRLKSLPLPLLVINGQPRISGQFDIRVLLDAIEVELEMKA